MNRQAIVGAIGGAIGAAILAAITYLVTAGGDAVVEGADALEEQRIRDIAKAVVEAELKTDNGKTVVEVLSEVRDGQRENTIILEGIRDDVDDLTDAVGALAAE